MTVAYLLDTNIFIEAWGRYYRPDVFPAFWTWLDGQQAANRIATIREVYVELTHGKGDLTDWIKLRQDSGWFLAESDEGVQEAFVRIANWVQQDRRWSATAKAEFLRGADPWLIASGIALGCHIVTLEKNDPNERKKILIPIVCKEFGVSTMNTFEMMRRLGARFE